MTKEERKEYQKAYREAHKEERKEYNKAYREAHKEERKEYLRAYHRAYSKNDTNSSGVTKNSIRHRSSRYLFNTIKHSKLKGYEIHHCFGYEDYKCFIYIPKELHLQIHQYLRDNHISVESNHYAQIAHLINEWDGYTYIKV